MSFEDSGMRRDPVASAATPWQTSKCHRVLRPLKLKINALERMLSASQSVVDGLTPWTSLSRRRAKREITSDSSAAYRPCSTRVRKYGNIRAKQKLCAAQGSVEASNDIFAEELLGCLRSKASPSLGSAYVGVYYAFTSILEKKETKQKFPTLASRAAYTVGRCIHLTSQQLGDDCIEADDWYESVPAHHRSTLVVGNALQLILSAARHLQPLLPVIALSVGDSPLSLLVMGTILDLVDISTCRKADLQELQALTERINAPWALKRHYAENFRIDYLKHAAFHVLLDHKSDTDLDYYTQALYIKANIAVLHHLRRCHREECIPDVRYHECLEQMSYRVIRNADAEFVKLLQNMHYELAIETNHVALAYSLAVLVNDVANVEIVHVIREQTDTSIRTSVKEKEACLDYLTLVFPSERLVNVVESLVGREDDLAIILANTCATTFEGDFITWAATIEKDVLQAKCGGDELKYRFEPLLDSWVAKTPGVQKIMHSKAVTRIRDESDDDSTSVDDDDYQADYSRSQLSFAEIECEDEDDLLQDFLSHGQNVPANLLEVLSHKKPSQTLLSGRLLQRYGKLSSQSKHSDSPLAQKQSRGLTSSEPQMLLCPSPLVTRTSKRRQNDAGYPVVPAGDHGRQTKRRKITDIHLAQPTFLKSPDATPERRVARKALRELNKLKSSFATLRQKQCRKPVPLHLETETEDEPAEEDDEISCVITLHPKSEIDELSML